MRVIIEYIRLIVFVGGAFIGVQVPSFVDQYQRQLEAHLSESQSGLKEFQYDADKFFGGDIRKLIRHYRKNDDPVFSDGGDSISALYVRNQLLRESLNDFQSEFYSPYWHTLTSPVHEIRNETWAGYDFAVKLNLNGILWALAVGFVLSLLVDLMVAVPRALFGRPRPRSGKPKLNSKRGRNFEHRPPEL